MKTTASAEAMRKLRAKRQESGLCSRCGRPNNGTSSFCSSCIKQLKGYKKPKVQHAFRKITKWTVTNHSLYNYMVENSISAKQLAQMAGVSERTVLRWVFEKAVPKEPVKSKVEALIKREVF
jgi:predicted amidophosphoribosyltransferase